MGLCIALFDVLSAGDEYIHPGDGGATLHVEFRLIVFRPFVGEVLTGIVRSCSPKGINGALYACCLPTMRLEVVVVVVVMVL